MGLVQLPAEGRVDDPPVWPLGGRVSAAERVLWVTLWHTPQAVAWERLGDGCVREVARYARLSVVCEKLGAQSSLHAQVTALADRLGLTPKAMRMLLWEVVTPDIAAAKSDGDDEADVRNRIKAV